MVTGTITGHTNVERNFLQSFVLTQQEGSLRIQSSFFKYLDSISWSGERVSDAATGRKNLDEVVKNMAAQAASGNALPDANSEAPSVESLDSAIVKVGSMTIDKVSWVRSN